MLDLNLQLILGVHTSYGLLYKAWDLYFFHIWKRDREWIIPASEPWVSLAKIPRVNKNLESP